MVRGIQRLIDDIRNPKASKKRRKKKIDELPDLPFFPKFKAPPIFKASKELAKIFVDLGPEAGNPRFFDEPAPIITRHTAEQLAYEANKGREKVTRREEDAMQNELQDLFDQLPTEGEQELAYLTLREENERGAQNQTLENALARMGADRPRQFQTSRPPTPISDYTQE